MTDKRSDFSKTMKEFWDRKKKKKDAPGPKNFGAAMKKFWEKKGNG